MYPNNSHQIRNYYYNISPPFQSFSIVCMLSHNRPAHKCTLHHKLSKVDRQKHYQSQTMGAAWYRRVLTPQILISNIKSDANIQKWFGYIMRQWLAYGLSKQCLLFKVFWLQIVKRQGKEDVTQFHYSKCSQEIRLFANFARFFIFHQW